MTISAWSFVRAAVLHRDDVVPTGALEEASEAILRTEEQGPAFPRETGFGSLLVELHPADRISGPQGAPVAGSHLVQLDGLADPLQGPGANPMKVDAFKVDGLVYGVGDEELAERLRSGTPAVVGRVQAGWLLLDVRTVFPEQESDLIESIRTAAR